MSRRSLRPLTRAEPTTAFDPLRTFGDTAYRDCISDPSGGGMDIHKPKPWRGVTGASWLKRGTCIIVVGVLTALAAEQVVESLHWSRQTGEARRALGREYSADLAYLNTNASQNACIRIRLGQLEQWARGVPAPRAKRSGRPCSTSRTALGV